MKLKLKKHFLKGKLIVFEGADGSGKTTLALKAKQILEQKGFECVYVKMPSQRVRNIDLFDKFDNSIDDNVRKTVDLTNLTVFVTGDRLLTQDTEIIPALREGKIVICDRYFFTGYVRCTNKVIASLCKKALKPDMIILAKISLEIAKNRVKSRPNEKNNYYDDADVILQIKKFSSLALAHHFEIIDTTQKKQIVDDKLNDILKKLLSKH